MRLRIFLLLVFLCTAPPNTHGALPAEEAAKVIGKPTALVVTPASVMLSGPRSTRQLVVTGKYADGSVRDLTHLVVARIDGDQAVIDEVLFISPRKNASSIMIHAGQQKIFVPVQVSDMEKPQPVSFRSELIAVLNVGGCNQGACHGTPTGKNGFKLSLRGYDPAADHVQLTHDVWGRRSDRQDPEGSLIYLKALGRVPHEGGVRFTADCLPARTMFIWLAEGSGHDLATAPVLKKIEVLPGSRVLHQPSRWQQLAVLAHFSNGAVRDVTRLTVFSSSDTALATVSPTGLVEFTQAGEVAILCRYLEEMLPVRLMYLEPRPGFRWPSPPENNYIDKHVFAKLKMLDIEPSELCTDQEFVRRVFMDVCGILPRPDEVEQFLASKEPNKRATLVDQLLERPEYADLWTLKWSDVLRSSRKTLQLKGVQAFQKWLRDKIEKNAPYDEMVRELITAAGSTFENPPAGYYRIAREPTALAETTAQLFFGIRMQCAKCHNHPFERWTQDDYYSLAAFFAQVRQKADPKAPGDKKKKDGAEIIFFEKNTDIIHPRTGNSAVPRFLGAVTPAIPGDKDRREELAKWMSATDNPFLARSVVNRIWFHLHGRGIVDPVDDFRDSNPSANDELLDALARDFVAKKFDMKYIIRTMLNSRTYQLSAQTNAFNKDDVKYFSHAMTKVYSAEPLFDALCQVTGVPEKFANMPPGTRAVQLYDSEFNIPFLKAFGQPARELACECERDGDTSLTQSLQMINGPSITERLRQPDNRIGKLLAAKKSDVEILTELFLVSLSRQPRAVESQTFLAHVGNAMDRRKAWEDVLWALINSKEFQFRH